MRDTSYHANWQKSRISFILSKYGKSFFVGKKMLELGSFNGYIGSYFHNIGSDVLMVEGRMGNVENIKNDYPGCQVICCDLDTTDWNFGKCDIIINFGLFYHLEKNHKQHMLNCINNCDLMFFETVVYDSYDSELFFRSEIGDDQSLSGSGGVPSTKYVEDIFRECGAKFLKVTNSDLNGDCHHYDWFDSGSKVEDAFSRRLWIVKK